MSHQQMQKEQNFRDEEEDNEEGIRSMEESDWWSDEEEKIVSDRNAKQKEESNQMVALLKADNKILEGKLENLEGKLQNLKLKAQIRAMTEEANLNKLKEENKAIRAKMEAAEAKANKLETTVKEIQQVSSKEIAILKEQMKKQGINFDPMDMSWTDLIKGKKVGNPQGNRLADSEFAIDTKVSANGLNATNNKNAYYEHCFAEKKFCLSVEDWRKDNFPGLIFHYFEVTQMSSKPSGQICVGLSNGDIPDISNATNSPNCYAIWAGKDCCFLSGRVHDFKWPNCTIKPKWYGQGDIIGCGILISPENKMFIFFTLNGILMGKKIPIGHPGDSLFPTVRLCDASVEANFGDNSAKRFYYNINKCPGMQH